MSDALCVTINGSVRQLAVPGNEFLLELLRQCGLTGAKEGCGEGECGACTVLIDGIAARSCLVFAHSVDGSNIQTIEGLASADGLDPIQEAFDSKNAVQCGYCTPGFIMQTKQLLSVNPDPSDEEIRYALSGNLCRCTGYQTIVDAVKEAARKMRGQL